MKHEVINRYDGLFLKQHFVEIIEDQFDFHTYCMRKMTLKSYVGLLRLEDVLRSHPFYFSAARCAVEVYLHLHDHPLRDEPSEEDIKAATLPPADLKKLKAQQRKAAKKAEQEKQERLQQERKEQQQQHHKRPHNQQDKEPDAPPVDDLLPQKLATVEDPLEQAMKFLQPLQEFASNRIETHLLAFEVYLRKRKPLLMVQSVKRALKVDANHPELHSCLIRLFRFLDEGKLLSDAVSNAAVAAVLQTESQTLFNNMDASQLNKQFLEHKANSLPHRLQGAKLMYVLDPSREEEAVSIVTDLKNEMEGVTPEVSSKILKALRDGEFGEKGRQSVDLFKSACNLRFPFATDFISGQPTAANHNHTDDVDQSLTNHVATLSVEDGTN